MSQPELTTQIQVNTPTADAFRERVNHAAAIDSAYRRGQVHALERVQNEILTAHFYIRRQRVKGGSHMARLADRVADILDEVTGSKGEGE